MARSWIFVTNGGVTGGMAANGQCAFTQGVEHAQFFGHRSGSEVVTHGAFALEDDFLDLHAEMAVLSFSRSVDRQAWGTLAC
jgi:hypothetical protein